MPTDDGFLPWLRSALRHLYDPVALRDSPLVDVLGLAESADPASDLRHTLTRAIRSLQPEAEMPADTQMWRVYEVLLYRYVQRCSQLEVADQLGISIRHLGREERKALQVLADRLRQQPKGQASAGQPPLEHAAASHEGGPCPIDNELAWLGGPAPEETVDLRQVLPATLDLVRPMARQHGVTLQVEPCPQSVRLAIHPVALRQILLSLLGVAIRQASGAGVSVWVRSLDWNVEVRVQCLGRAPAPEDSAEDTEGIAASLEVTRRLIDTCGGRLTLGSEGARFLATATLPALEQLPVLVIDDNVNTLRLLQRYVSSSRYRLVAATNLEEGLALAREASPRVIVLDVMMPDLDGWEALGRLRQHPLTAGVPIVVCTILAEEELALSLGASGYVRKPVSREAFLSALDRQADPAAPGSR